MPRYALPFSCHASSSLVIIVASAVFALRVRRLILLAAAAFGCQGEAWSHGASGLWECRLPQA